MFSPYWIILILIPLMLHLRIRYGRVGRMLDRIPGPFALPFIGNILLFNVHPNKMWDQVQDYCSYYYPMIRLWVGPIPAVAIYHPDDLEIFLTNHRNIEKSAAYRLLYPWLGTGLVTSKGEKWRQRRKILTQAFHFNILKDYMNVVFTHTRTFIHSLRADGEESVQEVLPLFMPLALRIFCEAAMGVSMDELGSETAEEYVNAVREMNEVLVRRLLKPYISDKYLFLWPEIHRKHRKILKILHGFTKKLIEKRKAYHIQSNYEQLKGLNSNGMMKVTSNTNVYTEPRKKLAMLDLLLSASRDGLIDDRGILEEVNTFIFAGHDTTATTLTFCLLLLAEDEDAQERARAEVEEIFASSPGEIGSAEIQQLHYVERCVKETLRLYPVVSAFLRRLTEDLKLKNHTVPAGTQIAVNLWMTHRDPNFWTEPTKFDPDRFLPERAQARHPFAYVPFSAGPRNCIGQKFSIMEIKSMLAEILYNFRIEPTDDDTARFLKIKPAIVIQPQKPVYLRFIRIDREK